MDWIQNKRVYRNHSALRSFKRSRLKVHYLWKVKWALFYSYFIFSKYIWYFTNIYKFKTISLKEIKISNHLYLKEFRSKKYSQRQLIWISLGQIVWTELYLDHLNSVAQLCEMEKQIQQWSHPDLALWLQHRVSCIWKYEKIKIIQQMKIKQLSLKLQ